MMPKFGFGELPVEDLCYPLFYYQGTVTDKWQSENKYLVHYLIHCNTA